MIDHWHFALCVGAALLMGMAIGVERQFGQHPAGVRTNTLVAIGAALFVLLNRLMVPAGGDATRISAQIVSGIGFLGGGVILREGLSVRGMNTAATLWCSAAVGALAGAGLIVEGLIATLAILAVLVALRPMVHWIDDLCKKSGKVETAYRVKIACAGDQAQLVRTICMRHVQGEPGLFVQAVATHEAEGGGRQATVTIDVSSKARNDKYMNALVERLNIESAVSGVSWERLP